MRNICVCIGLSMLLVSTSCEKGDDTPSPQCITHPDIRLAGHDTLSFQKIPLDVDVELTKKILLVNDSIALNIKDQKAGNFIDAVNIKSGKTIKSYFSVGEGPDEMLFCDVQSDGQTLIATDYIRNRFAQVDIDSLTNQSFMPEFIGFPYDIAITSNPLMANDSIIMLNPLRYVNKKCKINQDAPRFIHVRVGDKNCPQEEAPEYYTQNVGQGKMIRNSQTGDIWVLSLEKSIIEVYDSNLILKKNIVIPSDVSQDADVTIDETSTGKYICYKNHRPLAFTDGKISSDNKRIYLCLVGKNIGKYENDNDSPSHILVMDWDGNLIKTYYTPFRIYSLSITDSNIYATIEDDEENRILAKLTP